MQDLPSRYCSSVGGGGALFTAAAGPREDDRGGRDYPGWRRLLALSFSSRRPTSIPGEDGVPGTLVDPEDATRPSTSAQATSLLPLVMVATTPALLPAMWVWMLVVVGVAGASLEV